MKNKIQKYKHYIPSTNANLNKCPNCETLHKGNYCHNCGQSISEVNKPFKDFLIDILGTLYAFDLKFWNSIKVLFTKPEKLSREFINGKRAAYTPPFKLYFFVSFIFFFMVNWKAESGLEKDNFFKIDNTNNVSETDLKDSIISEINKNETLIISSDSLSLINATDSVFNEKVSGFLNFSNNRIGEIFNDKGTKLLFMNKALKYSSWMVFLLMPLFALILMMLHYKREKYYLSHLIFAVNTHTQTFMILILVMLLEFSAKGLLVIMMPVYMIWGMKKFYNQSWGKTIFKFFILTSLYNFVLLAAFIVVFIFTLGTF